MKRTSTFTLAALGAAVLIGSSSGPLLRSGGAEEDSTGNARQERLHIQLLGVSQ